MDEKKLQDISASLDHELSLEEERAIEAMLESSADARELLTQFQKVDTGFSRLPRPAPLTKEEREKLDDTVLQALWSTDTTQQASFESPLDSPLDNSLDNPLDNPLKLPAPLPRKKPKQSKKQRSPLPYFASAAAIAAILLTSITIVANNVLSNGTNDETIVGSEASHAPEDAGTSQLPQTRKDNNNDMETTHKKRSTPKPAPETYENTEKDDSPFSLVPAPLPTLVLQTEKELHDLLLQSRTTQQETVSDGKNAAALPDFPDCLLPEGFRPDTMLEGSWKGLPVVFLIGPFTASWQSDVIAVLDPTTCDFLTIVN